MRSSFVTWLFIVLTSLVAIATAALGFYTAHLGLYAWFSIPLVASMVMMVAHEIWIWRLPLPSTEELVENV